MQVGLIAEGLRSQIVDKEEELAKLHEALEAVEALAPTVEAPEPVEARTAPHRPTRAHTRGRRTAILTPDTILPLITPEGIATRELSAQLHGSISRTREALRRLENAGEIRRTGIRSTVRWHRVNQVNQPGLTEAEKLEAAQQALIDEAALIERRREAGRKGAEARWAHRKEAEKIEN